MKKKSVYDCMAGTTDGDRKLVMPQPEISSRSSARTIGELVRTLEEFLNNNDEVRANYPWADRFVMGMPLPSWQRQFKWNQDQAARFITSVWTGVDLGSYLINEPANMRFAKDGSLAPLSDVVLDGQQRLTVLEKYLLGEFAVPDATGTPRYWMDLGQLERRNFRSTCFTRSTVSSYDEALLRRVYDLRNFGGTAHTEDERALPAGTPL